MEKKNNVTELVFIIDKSGSMAGLVDDTIGGFNGFLERERTKEGECLVTTVLFDDKYVTLHDRVPIREVPKMTEKDYRAGGCTALIDALGDTIRHISDIHRYARKEDVPDNTIFVITTDGMENSSHKYTSDEVKTMIRKKSDENWNFIFLAANIDAVETAKTYGIREEHAVNYCADKIGTKMAYGAMELAVSSLRETGSVYEKWGEEVAADHKKRKKR